jgi:hypothetical protein
MEKEDKRKMKIKNREVIDLAERRAKKLPRVNARVGLI